MVDPVTIDITSGPDTTTNTTLLSAAWEKDYFTSSRPWTQKGPEITIPLAGNAPVVSDGTASTITGLTSGATGTLGYSTSIGLHGVAPGSGSWTNNEPVAFGSNSGLEADLSAVPGVDVNDLRLALALQRYEEARARYGSRRS